MIRRTTWSEFVFAMVLAAVVFVTITTLAAMPKGPPVSEASTTGPIFQPVFQKVF